MKTTSSASLTMIMLLLMAPATSAYEEGAAGQAVIQGTISFKGTPPAPKLFDLDKFPQPRFCGEADNDGKGHRVLRYVTVNNGRLQDVVVYVRDITRGKPFHFNGTDVTIDHCHFLVQGGPSTMVGVVVNGGDLRILNTDNDADDPRYANGVLHNPHGYGIAGHMSYGLFSSVLPNKGQLLTKQVKLREPGDDMLLQCDQHSYENAYFHQIQNPYFAIVGSDGTFSIDQVPAGTYTLIAWHPILGVQKKTIEVGSTGKVVVNYEFSN